jgi:hypothetical protein
MTILTVLVIWVVAAIIALIIFCIGSRRVDDLIARNRLRAEERMGVVRRKLCSMKRE